MTLVEFTLCACSGSPPSTTKKSKLLVPTKALTIG